jgi:tRNA threonylcarbamoyl adenosine modification protein (Sua5/YciO/YrdC/YwlC family)
MIYAWDMARYFDIHPKDPQPRLVAQVVDLLGKQRLIAYPTDSGYALGCALGNREGLERIRTIRQLNERHHFTLVCSEFAQLGRYVEMDNDVFRAVKAATPGQYTFILKASREAPKAMLQPRRKTVGVRIPKHPVALALVRELGEPLVSSTLILPGQEDPLTEGWIVNDEIGPEVDAVIDGECGLEPTTVVDLSGEEVEILRYGAGDPTPFE